MKTQEKPAGEERPAILIVDDEPVVRNAFQIFFETMGFAVAVAQGGDEALVTFEAKNRHFDVVLLDLVMPGSHGIDVLRRLKSLDASVEVIIATGCGSMSTAIEAMRHGAFDYITKPVIDLDDDLLSVVRSAITHRKEKQAPGSHSAEAPKSEFEPADYALARFYVELEGLARDMSWVSRRSQGWGAMAGLVEKHLKAIAFFVIKPTHELKAGTTASTTRKTVCLERFGPWSEILDPSMGAWKTGELEKAVSKPLLWQKLEANFPLEGSGPKCAPCSLEACCIPVDDPQRRDRSSLGGVAAMLLIVRRIQGWRSAPSPEGALLGLVAEKILEKP